jgi:hypothetical protein
MARNARSTLESGHKIGTPTGQGDIRVTQTLRFEDRGAASGKSGLVPPFCV